MKIQRMALFHQMSMGFFYYNEFSEIWKEIKNRVYVYFFCFFQQT